MRYFRNVYLLIALLSIAISFSFITRADEPAKTSETAAPEKTPSPDKSEKEAETLSITGKAVPGYEGLEKAALDYRELVKCSATTMAISRDGKILFTRGYGWRDSDHKNATQPDDLFRIASVTKPITAALIRNLIAEKKLKESSLVFDLIEEKVEEYQPHDNRWRKITVEHLLLHKGGWDRDEAFDPMFYTETIRKKMRLVHRPNPVEVIQFMLDEHLQFDPGARVSYSNFGYLVLGRVAEAVTKDTYYNALDQYLLKPSEISQVKLAKRRANERFPTEPNYTLPRDLFDIEVMDSHGGLVANAESLCQFLSKYWLTGFARKVGEPEQELSRYGSLMGTTAVVRQHNGWDVAILYNGRREGENGKGNYVWHQDFLDMIKKVDAEIEKLPIQK